MEIKNFTITKRDGGKDRFSMDKIMNAIIKAFDSVNEPIDLGNVSKLISRLNIYNNIKVEDIQNQVEEALMAEGFFKVAKSFMLYRQQHTEDRETLERLKFLTDYMLWLPMPANTSSKVLSFITMFSQTLPSYGRYPGKILGIQASSWIHSCPPPVNSFQ